MHRINDYVIQYYNTEFVAEITAVLNAAQTHHEGAMVASSSSSGPFVDAPTELLIFSTLRRCAGINAH